MQQSHTIEGTLRLEDLPLLAGQAEELKRKGFSKAEELLHHPAVQEALQHILAESARDWDPEVLDTPIEEFLDGPGLDRIAAEGVTTLGDLLSLPVEVQAEAADLNWHPERLLAAIGLPESADRGNRLSHPIEKVAKSPRALRACRNLGAHTVGDFLSLAKDDFLAQRNVGIKTWEDLTLAVNTYLEAQGGEGTEPMGLATRLDQIVENRRALKAFASLGLVTAADFLATPKEKLLEMRNFGERTWWDVSARIGNLVDGTPALPRALPKSLLQFPLANLPLAKRLRSSLEELGLDTVGSLLQTPRTVLMSRRNFGDDSWDSLVRTLDDAVTRGLDAYQSPAPEEMAGLDQFRELLYSRVPELRDQLILGARTGLDWHRPRTLQDLARELNISKERVRQVATRIREDLERMAAPMLEYLTEEVDRALAAEGGLLTEDALLRLPLGSGEAPPPARAQALVGTLLFFYPDRYLELQVGGLTDASRQSLRRLTRALRRRMTPERLPLELESLASVLESCGLSGQGYLGLGRHLLKKRFAARITRDREGREVVTLRQGGTVRQLAEILTGSGKALTVTDLQNNFRNLYHSISRNRVLSLMYTESQFVQVGPDKFDLATRFTCSESVASMWRRHAAERLSLECRPMQVQQLIEDENPYMVAQALRSAAEFRYLGGLVFTLAEAGTTRPSWVEAAIMEFLSNLDRPVRSSDIMRAVTIPGGPASRTIQSLLQESRLFARFPDNTIGLAENHPITPDQRREIGDSMVEGLAQARGYGRLVETREELIAAGRIGGETSEEELRDILVRDGRFDFFGGDFYTDTKSNVVKGLLERLQAVLGAAEEPLYLHQVLGERPDLAEFEPALETLLDRHPLVVALQDGRYGILR